MIYEPISLIHLRGFFRFFLKIFFLHFEDIVQETRPQNEGKNQQKRQKILEMD